MTRPDNDLLRVADQHYELMRSAASAIDAACALIAFAALCGLLWLALHLGVVPV